MEKMGSRISGLEHSGKLGDKRGYHRQDLRFLVRNEKVVSSILIGSTNLSYPRHDPTSRSQRWPRLCAGAGFERRQVLNRAAYQ